MLNPQRLHWIMNHKVWSQSTHVPVVWDCQVLSVGTRMTKFVATNLVPAATVYKWGPGNQNEVLLPSSVAVSLFGFHCTKYSRSYSQQWCSTITNNSTMGWWAPCCCFKSFWGFTVLDTGGGHWDSAIILHSFELRLNDQYHSLSIPRHSRKPTAMQANVTCHLTSPRTRCPQW